MNRRAVWRGGSSRPMFGAPRKPSLSTALNAARITNSEAMLQLLTLGRLSLGEGDRQLLVGRRKVLALLVYVARRDGQRVSRAVLADLLWPDVDEHRAKQSLRTALTELRGAVGDAIESDADDIVVPRGAVELDITQMAGDVARREFAAATDRWHGEFLEGLDDLGNEDWRVWLDAERAAASKQLDWAFEHLLTACESAGRWSEAIGHTERWTNARPGNERAASRAVVALRTVGRTGEALARHAALSRRLLDANGTAPSPAFAALAGTLRPDTTARPGIRGLLTPEIVGREESLSVLTTAWTRARQGGGCCVFVDGEEGLGKTRLIEEFGRTLRGAKGAVLLQTRAFAAERNRPLAVLRQLAEQLADAPGLAAVAASALAALGSISASIRERFPQPAGSSEEPLADAFVRALGDVAFEVPVAVLIDDAPIADTASLAMIEAIARRPPPHVLVVLTGRSDRWEQWQAIAELRNAAHVSWCALAPLTRAQTRRLLEGVGPIDPDIVQALGDRLHDDTQGRPGSIDILIRQLADQRTLTPDAAGRWTLTTDVAALQLPVPEEISGSIRARLTGASDDTRRVVECAAVVGPRIDVARLEAASGLTPDRFRAAIADLFSRRLLRNSAAGDGRLEFSGEAERRAVYEQIVPSTRRAMHRGARDHDRLAGRSRFRRPALVAAAAVAAVVGVLAARRLAPSPADVPEGTQVLLANVQNLTTDSSLGPALDLAARVGLQRSKQVRLFPAQQVRESLARMRKTVTPGAVDERVAQEIAIRENLPAFIYLAIAAVDSAFLITGRVVEAEHGRDLFSTDARAAGRSEILPSLDAVLTQVRGALGESRLVMRRERPLPLVTTSSLDALRFYVLGNNAWTLGHRPEAKASWARALELDSSFALALSSMGLFYYFEGDSGIDRAIGDRYYDRALAQADRLTERERMALAAAVASMRGTPDEAVEKQRVLAERFPERDTWYNLGSTLMRNRRTDEAVVALRRSLAFDSTFANAWINLATAHDLAGRIDSALYAYEHAAAIGTTHLTTGGNVNQEWGGALARAGRVAAAESLYKRAATDGSTLDRALGLRSVGWLAMSRGRYREAAAALEQAVALAANERWGLTAARNRWILASVYLELGDVARARAELVRAEQVLGEVETEPIYLLYLAALHLRVGNVPRALALQHRLERTAHEQSPTDRASRALLQAMMALRNGRPDTAIALARGGDPVPLPGLRDAMLADGYEQAGAPDSAIAAAKRLEARWQFGFEVQPTWRRVALHIARLSLATGDTAQARAALERQLAVWKDADTEFPDLVESRRLLARLNSQR